jgi:aspartate carbamoyltransferase catalytic subunit
MRHLIEPIDLSVADIHEILTLAEDIIANRAQKQTIEQAKSLSK